MGRRSRKRARPAAERVVEATPATRSADPTEPAASPRAETRRERERARRDRLPPPPWAPVPLVELAVLAALIIGVIGFFSPGKGGAILLVCAAVLGSLAGLEVAIREHFAGFKSHTTLLAGSAAVLTMMLIYTVGGQTLAGFAIAVATGVLIFVLAFWRFRESFRSRSGGATFR